MSFLRKLFRSPEIHKAPAPDWTREIGQLNSENMNIRFTAIRRLGEFKVVNAVVPLITALKDDSALIRSEAIEALARIGDNRAVEPLIAILNEGDHDLQITAIWALGIIGDTRAREPLLVALKGDGKVRWAAVTALRCMDLPLQISGIPVRFVRKTDPEPKLYLYKDSAHFTIPGTDGFELIGPEDFLFTRSGSIEHETTVEIGTRTDRQVVRLGDYDPGTGDFKSRTYAPVEHPVFEKRSTWEKVQFYWHGGVKAGVPFLNEIGQEEYQELKASQ